MSLFWIKEKLYIYIYDLLLFICSLLEKNMFFIKKKIIIRIMLREKILLI